MILLMTYGSHGIIGTRCTRRDGGLAGDEETVHGAGSVVLLAAKPEQIQLAHN